MSEDMTIIYKQQAECLRREYRHLLDLLEVKDKETDRTDAIIIELVKLLKICRDRLDQDPEMVENIDRVISKVYEV